MLAGSEHQIRGSLRYNHCSDHTKAPESRLWAGLALPPAPPLFIHLLLTHPPHPTHPPLLFFLPLFSFLLPLNFFSSFLFFLPLLCLLFLLLHPFPALLHFPMNPHPQQAKCLKSDMGPLTWTQAPGTAAYTPQSHEGAACTWIIIKAGLTITLAETREDGVIHLGASVPKGQYAVRVQVSLTFMTSCCQSCVSVV